MTDQSVAREVPAALSLAGLPEHIAQQLVRAVEAVRTSSNGGTDRASIDADLVASGDLIRAAQAVSAWGESLEIEGARRLLQTIERDPLVDLGQREPRSNHRTQRAEARRASALELQVLSGRSLSQCRDLIAVAAATDLRGGYLRARLTSGTTRAHRVATLMKETRHLDPVTADRIARAVLRPVGSPATDAADPDALAAEITAAAESPAPLSQSTFRRRLRLELTRAESASGVHDRLAVEAVGAREMRTEPSSFGMAATFITAERDRAFAATTRIDRLARAARAGGDGRTLDQLRSDIATDLLIRGQVPGDALLGAAPAARLQVVVPLEAVLPWVDVGEAPPVGEVPGLGFLTPEQVRRVALAAGSTWRRLVTDPVTGAVIDAGRTYRPSQSVRELVVARDGACRAPGCDLPALEADLDHTVPWSAGAIGPQDGATHPDNLKVMHRGHHHAKTRRWWTCSQDPGGVVRWRTLTGRHLLDRPPDRRAREDLSARRRTSDVDRLIAAIRDDALDPQPISIEMAALHRSLTRPDPVALERHRRAERGSDPDPPPF